MRYIGNKSKLLGEIKDLLLNKKIYKKGLVFCDMFAGTCSVADAFKDTYKIIANDTLYTSYTISRGKLKKRKNYFANLGFDPFNYFNTVDCSEYTDGFCYKTFAPNISGRQYFSDHNAKKIDYIRNTIDEWFNEDKINEDERCYLIGSLIESVSKVSNVAGVYSAYLKKWDPRALKDMRFIPLESDDNALYENDIYSEDANELIEKIQGDILYLDPPYTSTQYISQYHTLETIAKNDCPQVHGVGAHRDNGDQISPWCKKGIVQAEFEKIIRKSKFKHIIVSYSDAGILSKEYIENVMKKYAKRGTYYVREIDFVKYKSARTVKREIRENSVNKKHFEYLFYIEKDGQDTKVLSPLNYIGGKCDSIDFINSNMPDGIDCFYDLFGGGGNVSLNVKAKKVVYNDINWIVVKLLKDLAETDAGAILKYIEKQMAKYDLKKANKDAFYNLRDYYNSKDIMNRSSLDLYLLICYGFEHQIRFNSKLEFNNPCGNSGFNGSMLEKLIAYKNRVKEIDISFVSGDYRALSKEISKKDFVYCDPPYINSRGAYNDGKRGFNGWDRRQDEELRQFLDSLNDKGIRFMLSNMASRDDDGDNSELMAWAGVNGYKVIEDDVVTKRNRRNRREIIVINY